MGCYYAAAPTTPLFSLSPTHAGLLLRCCTHDAPFLLIPNSRWAATTLLHPRRPFSLYPQLTLGCYYAAVPKTPLISLSLTHAGPLPRCCAQDAPFLCKAADILSPSFSDSSFVIDPRHNTHSWPVIITQHNPS